MVDEVKEPEAPMVVVAAANPLAIPAADGNGVTLKASAGASDVTTASIAIADKITAGLTVHAALAEVAQSTADKTQPAEWLGEPFIKRQANQQYAPVFAKRPLTGLVMKGFKWGQGPAVAPLDRATSSEPASQNVTVAGVDVSATRYASANKFDRSIQDFRAAAFWDGYFRERGREVNKFVDNGAATHMFTAGNYAAVTSEVADASDVAALTTLDPTNAQKLAYHALNMIVDGIIKVSDYAVPDFAYLPDYLYRAVLMLGNANAFAYLNIALGLDPEEGTLNGKFRIRRSPHSALGQTTGWTPDDLKVFVGASEAHTMWEPKEFSVDAVNISTSDIEVALFGYWALFTHEANAFALVTPKE
jgi:hypothetical protein